MTFRNPVRTLAKQVLPMRAQDVLRGFSKLRRQSPPSVEAGPKPISLIQHVDRTRLFAPHQVFRLGTGYGGWTLPIRSSLTSDSICYSAGAGEDISFDCALAQLFGCQVRLIDPTPRAIKHFEALGKALRNGECFPVNNSPDEFYDVTVEAFERLSLAPVGLFDQDGEQKFYLPRNSAHVSCSILNLPKTTQYFTAACLSTATVMRLFKDTAIDLLKMDIEGSEYAVIRDLVFNKILPRMLLVEFDEAHTPMDEGASDRIQQHIEMLIRAGMRCIFIEGSNMSFLKEPI